MRELFGRSLWEMVKGRWREFVREPSAFFFVIFMPLLWMLILGFAFSSPHKESYGVGWQNDGSDAGPVAAAVHGALEHDARVRLEEGSAAELGERLKRGEIVVIVQPVAAGPWVYWLDPANREATRARAALDDLVQAAAGRRDVVATTERKVEVPGTRYIDFLVPGLIALSIMTSSLFGIGAVIVVNRRETLLKRYLATPMRPLTYIVSHLIGRLFVLAVELTAILLGGALMFHFRVAGSWGALLLVAVTGAAAFTAIAMLCGSRTSNMAVMNGMTNLITLPMMIVAGVWFSLANFPDWIAGPARYLPLTALVDALRRIALEGAGVAAVGRELGVLAAYLVAATVGAKVLFKWY
jgi:ABC-type multidrug transport system permease subunit